MPRASKGPRLWKRNARKHAGKVIQSAVWLIKDGGKHIATGCLASPLERKPPDAAVKALADYIAEKYRPPRKARDVDVIPLADVLSIYHADKREGFETDSLRRKFDRRIGRLNDFWGNDKLGSMSSARCGEYVRSRGTPGGARRDLEDLRAAINHHAKENLHTAVINVTLPEKGEARDRWLERSEAAKLLWAAYRYREVQTVHRGPNKGQKIETEKRPLRHLARFILIGLYSGTRAGAIASASPERDTGRSFVDLERGIYYRRARGKRITNKRQPPAPIAPRLLAHMRRWVRRGIVRTHFVEFNGLPVKSVKTGFATAVDLAKLPVDDGAVSPHTLRHTAATWLMQSGVDPWQAAGYLGMSVKTLLDTYGHHHPDYMQDAANAIGSKARGRKSNVTVVESVVEINRAAKKQGKP
jgi:integrase